HRATPWNIHLHQDNAQRCQGLHGLHLPGRHGEPGRFRRQREKRHQRRHQRRKDLRGLGVKRLPSTPRPDWKKKIEEQGLVVSTTTMPDGRKIEYWNESAYYEFTMDEVETLEKTAEDMHRMCLEAARFLASGAMGGIGIGEQALELAAESLQAGDMDIYGRFDFIYDGRGGPAKMLEYNADTPTGLIEAAVAQWFWLQDVRPEKDQWNGIHEALIRQWKKLQYPTGTST